MTSNTTSLQIPSKSLIRSQGCSHIPLAPHQPYDQIRTKSPASRGRVSPAHLSSFPADSAPDSPFYHLPACFSETSNKLPLSAQGSSVKTGEKLQLMQRTWKETNEIYVLMSRSHCPTLSLEASYHRYCGTPIFWWHNQISIIIGNGGQGVSG